MAAVILCAGCNGGKKPMAEMEHRALPANVGQVALTPETLREVYGVEAFVFAARDPASGRVTVCDSSSAAGGAPLDDCRLLVLVEGSGDRLEGFFFTARLLAASEHVWPAGDWPSLLILPLHWSQSTDAVLEHVNLDAQRRGAVALQDMVHAHALRYDGAPRPSVSLLGFSAGTRVVQMAFGATIEAADMTATRGECPPYMTTVSNVVFIGSSLWRGDPTPFENLRGRFINFVNPRDTHFGDQAPYIAPTGAGMKLEHLVNPTTILARPAGFGASARGFDALPSLTAPEQFDVADSLPEARRVFRQVNVRVPELLAAYNLVGGRIENDDLDAFINQAPNHYILAGRGPAGTTGGPQFEQYRAPAADFVRNFVAPAVVSGRIVATQLVAKAKPITPLDILTAPLTVPARVLEPIFKKPDEKPAPP